MIFSYTHATILKAFLNPYFYVWEYIFIYSIQWILLHSYCHPDGSSPREQASRRGCIWPFWWSTVFQYQLAYWRDVSSDGDWGGVFWLKTQKLIPLVLQVDTQSEDISLEKTRDHPSDSSSSSYSSNNPGDLYRSCDHPHTNPRIQPPHGSSLEQESESGTVGRTQALYWSGCYARWSPASRCRPPLTQSLRSYGSRSTPSSVCTASYADIYRTREPEVSQR